MKIVKLVTCDWVAMRCVELHEFHCSVMSFVELLEFSVLLLAAFIMLFLSDCCDTMELCRVKNKNLDAGRMGNSLTRQAIVQ